MPAADEVLSAQGLLAEFNTAEVIGAADVHTSRLICDLWEEPDDRVRLAVALVVRALRSGSVCLDITRLAELVIDTLEDPPAISPGPSPAGGRTPSAGPRRSRPGGAQQAVTHCVWSVICSIWNATGEPRRPSVSIW